MKKILQFTVCLFFCIAFSLFAEETADSADSGAKSGAQKTRRNYNQRRYYNKTVTFGDSLDLKTDIPEDKPKKSGSIFGNNNESPARDDAISRDRSARRPSPRKQNPASENDSNNWLVDALLNTKGVKKGDVANGDHTKIGSDDDWLVNEITALKDRRSFSIADTKPFAGEKQMDDSLSTEEKEGAYKSVFTSLGGTDANESIFKTHDAAKRGMYDVFKSLNPSSDKTFDQADKYTLSSPNAFIDNTDISTRHSYDASGFSSFGDIAPQRGLEKETNESGVHSDYSSFGRRREFSTAHLFGSSFDSSFDNVSDTKWKSPFDTHRSISSSKNFDQPAKYDYKPVVSSGFGAGGSDSTYSRFSKNPVYKSQFDDKRTMPRSVNQWD